MRILFGATPAPGHLLPLLPLADAAAESGHEVAFLTAETMAPFLHDRTLLSAGAGLEELFAEAAARSADDARHPGEGAVELFAGAVTYRSESSSSKNGSPRYGKERTP